MSTICECHEWLESQLSAFEAEVQQGQEEATTKALKRARHEKLHQYKKKGNEEQVRFDASVNKVLAEAKVDLSGPGTTLAIERAHQAIK